MSGVSSVSLNDRIADDFYQEKYKTTVSEYSIPNPVEMEKQVKKPLSERIIVKPLQTDGIFETHIVDCVKVRAVADTVRQERIAAWSAKKNEAESSAWKWGIGGTFLTVISAGATFSNMTHPLFASLIATIGVAAAVIGASVKVYESSEVSKKIAEWSTNPREEIAKQRTAAYERGFLNAFFGHLKFGDVKAKTPILHRAEVEHMYKNYTNGFFAKALDNTQHKGWDAWVHYFVTNNPFSIPMMEYGLGQIPAQYQAAVQDVRSFVLLMSQIGGSYDTLKTEVRNMADQQIKDINKKRDEELKPFVTLKESQLKVAKENCDRVLLNLSSTVNERDTATKNFSAIKETLEKDFKKNADPINKKYDDQVKAIEARRDAQLKRYDEQRSDQFNAKFQAGKEVCDKAYAAWKGYAQQYQPMNWGLYVPNYQQQPVTQQPYYYAPPAQYPAQYAYPAQPAQYPPQYAYPQQPAAYHQPYFHQQQ